MELCERLAMELRQPRYLYLVAMLGAALALLEGRHDEAEQAVQRAFEIGRRVDAGIAQTVYGVQLVTLRRQQGRLAEMLPAVQALLAARPSISARVTLSYVYAELGYRDAAAREFELLAAADFTDYVRDRMWLAGLAVLAEICVDIGDHRRGEQLYALLAPYAHHDIVAGEGAVAIGSASFQLGRLATMLERWSEAEAYLELCLAMNARIGAPAYRGQIYRAYAELLLARGWPGDHQRAAAFIADGLEVAGRFAMAGLRVRLLALRDGGDPILAAAGRR
jgi:tetratricopeptide (TPR) repeat protein